jgi:hypothetical protein
MKPRKAAEAHGAKMRRLWAEIKTKTTLQVGGTELAVCKDIAQRQLSGFRKYATTVEQNPATLRQWLTHAYEECLDQAVYLKRAMQEMDKP